VPDLAAVGTFVAKTNASKHMKRALFLLSFISISATGFAQQTTQTTKATYPARQHTSGFGGVLFEMAPIRGQVAASFGGGGAALFRNGVFFGGFGQSTAVAIPFTVSDVNYETRVSQGGLWLGYQSRLNQTLSLVGDLRLGWANIGLSRNGGATSYSRGFITTPSLNLQIEATPNVVFRVGVGYRLASTPSLALADGQGRTADRLTNQDFSGFAGTLSVLFGSF
jgi:hypothetical protein